MQDIFSFFFFVVFFTFPPASSPGTLVECVKVFDLGQSQSDQIRLTWALYAVKKKRSILVEKV